MDHSKQLGELEIPRLLLKFSIPAIIGMLVTASYNIIDRIFIGRGVGSLGIAGITIGFPIMILMMAFGMLIGLGATALISLKLGEQKKDEAENILGNGMILLVLIYSIISILGLLFIKPLLVLFGASESILPYAISYMRIILYGAVFQGIAFGMNNFIRAEGNPRIAMFTMLISAIINIILDPIFIFYFGLGIEGAAIATVISQMVSAVWVLYYFLGGGSTLKISIKNLSLNPEVIKKIVAIGSAPFALQIAASLLHIILNNSLGYYGGDVAISAIGIFQSIMMMILMPVFGINQGSQPIIGYNYGAKKYDRVKRTLKLAIMAASSIVLLGFIITRIFPQQLIMLFNSEDVELISIGIQAITIGFLALPFIGFQIVGANYFQAIGKPKQAMLLSLSRQVLLLIPAVLILPRFFGLLGVLMALPIADICSSLLTGTWLYLELKSLQKKDMEQTILNPQPVK